MLAMTAWLLTLAIGGRETPPTFVPGIATDAECYRLGNALKESSPYKARVVFTCTPYQTVVTVR